MNNRDSFSLKRKKWCLKRDGNKCQAPFKHICDTENSLQVHHILPHAYLNKVAPDVSADYPENFITLCRTAHEMIHPDVVWARQNYNRDTKIFAKLRSQRTMLMDNHRIYWIDSWDRQMMVVALINTKKFKKPFPVYRRRHEVIEDTETEGL